jgi:predicted Zn-dependent protease
LLMANRESLDLALVFAHEIGHIMGHGHTGPGTVMSLKSGESAWVAP